MLSVPSDGRSELAPSSLEAWPSPLPAETLVTCACAGRAFRIGGGWGGGGFLAAALTGGGGGVRGLGGERGVRSIGTAGVKGFASGGAPPGGRGGMGMLCCGEGRGYGRGEGWGEARSGSDDGLMVA